jgi:hypothetical protein
MRLSFWRQGDRRTNGLEQGTERLREAAQRSCQSQQQLVASLLFAEAALEHKQARLELDQVDRNPDERRRGRRGRF